MKKVTALLTCILLTVICCCQVNAADVPRESTPEYKVAFYASDCYHMQDENGRRYGYGYDMMQGISKYMQCTFSYVGYDKSAKECEEMLRNGELDIYTAAKVTPEREEEFVFSIHPAITAKTCMNIKRGNDNVVAGDYSTYNGLRIGLLERHTYNERFIQFTRERGIDCEIIYYSTPTDLSNALIDGEVDALVNSYIRTPEDEVVIEDFGETPYYFMARKEDSALIDKIDAAIDEMNVETPNWRSDLYNTYYGSQKSNIKLTDRERALLKQMKDTNTKVRAVMNPDRAPYSWYENGQGYGIIADLFVMTAKKLELDYELVPVSSKEEYEELIASGDVDIWLDIDSYYEDENRHKYKMSPTYLTTTVSVLHRRGVTGKMNKIGVMDNNIAVKEIISSLWPEAEIIPMDTTDQSVEEIINGKIDCVLMMGYSAQKIARDDTQNRLSVDIVPGALLNLSMGINADCSRYFYGIWEKTLADVAANNSEELVQTYLESSDTITLAAYLFDHPSYMLCIIVLVFLILFMIGLYIQSIKAKNRQLQISKQLSEALRETQIANDAKFNFFSKMSHDIRTPLNAVLGMTQIAKKYENNQEKLDNALENITSEGNYLLTMINSILDVNQLEYGHIELVNKTFNPDECLRESVNILMPLAQKREQTLTIISDNTDDIVIGDSGRFSQIMVNIVSNAIKYTDVGGKIIVKLERVNDNRYRFTCTDNGIGMSKEYIEHICEDYSRAEDSRTSATEGTGLGMAVVKGFTDLMNGTLSIQSELGKGSTFTIELPFEKPETKAESAAEGAIYNKGLTSHVDFKGKKVLLVEDNALNAEIATELLQSIGLTVDWAENGQIGVDKMEKSAINEYMAIFMDMQMPVMDGIEATRRIRTLNRADKDILIFAITANTLVNDRKRCEEAGMDAYITKPINLKEIERILRENIRLK